MTKDNAAQFLPLVQALAEGKTIQIRVGNKWTDIDDPHFGNEAERYRVKPKPLVRYVVRGYAGELIYINFDSASKGAERLNKLYNHEHAVHKMVEEL